MFQLFVKYLLGKLTTEKMENIPKMKTKSLWLCFQNAMEIITTIWSQQQLLFTTRFSATKVFQIYSSQGNYLQLDMLD